MIEPPGMFTRLVFVGIGRLPRFALLTCESNPLAASLHSKAMPVIDQDTWMDNLLEVGGIR